MSTRHVGRACAQSSNQLWMLYRTWRQVTKCGVCHSHMIMKRRSHERHMSIFQEFSHRLKGEIQSNPELQKSIKDFKEKAGDLKNRTKVTTEQLYKHVDAAREEAEARAKQVSAVVKEKVFEAKEKVSEASSQVKESVGSLKFGISQEGRSKESKSATERASVSSTGEKKSAAGASQATESHSGGDRCETAGAHSSKSTANAQEASRSKFATDFFGIPSSASAALWKLKETKFVDTAKEGYNFLKEELTATSSRKREKAPSTTEISDSTAVVAVVKKKSGWEKRWDDIKEKARAHPFYKHLKGVKGHPVVTKSQEIAEDLREKWETSDSPVVHKIQDLNESIFGETATAMAMREIKRRDPAFSFPEFVLEVQENVRPVLQAYLKGDLSELRKRCSREVVDRCRAERIAYESQGIYFDNKILHISDVEMKDTKLMGNVPIIIVAFQTQQIYCVRDKLGNITQGAKDDIHTVYYAWALQQVSPEEMGDGYLHPWWQLREMQQLGVQAII